MPLIPEALKHQDPLYYLQLGSFCLAFLFLNSWRYWTLILISATATAVINVKTRPDDESP